VIHYSDPKTAVPPTLPAHPSPQRIEKTKRELGAGFVIFNGGEHFETKI
jgi:hypothetical protein